MSKGARRPVHPAASAFLILLVLAAVQWVWWRFLIYTPRGTGGGPPSQMRTGQQATLMLGRADVTVTTLAGDTQPGDQDGPPHAARFDRPTGLALDSHGNLLVADTGNDRVRMVTPTGETLTAAGGEAGFADGPAAQARFRAPCGVCVGTDGSVYVADTGNYSVRRISGGQVTTIAGGPATGAAPPAARPVGMPTAIAFAAGAPPTLLVADALGKSVRTLSLDGTVKSERKTDGAAVGIAAQDSAVAVPSKGEILIGARRLTNAPFQPTDEVDATKARQLAVKRPVGLCPFGKGMLLTADDHGAVLFLVNNAVQVIAGHCISGRYLKAHLDGDGRTSLFGSLTGIAADGKQFVYVADTGSNCIRRLDVSEARLH